MLRILFEERLGYPTALVSDGLIPEIRSALNGAASVYDALARGEAHIWPEARIRWVRTPIHARNRPFIPGLDV